MSKFKEQRTRNEVVKPYFGTSLERESYSQNHFGVEGVLKRHGRVLCLLCVAVGNASGPVSSVCLAANAVACSTAVYSVALLCSLAQINW